MSFIIAQRRLFQLHLYTGPTTGALDAATARGLLLHVARRAERPTDAPLAAELARQWPDVDVTTPLRVAHFLAQASHETGGFRRFVELGSGDGPDADPYDDYLGRYDGRADLGNDQPGDGERFRGRGIFQVTGRANYERYGRLLGVDLVAQPQLAATPAVSVGVACKFWEAARLNARADVDDVRGVTRRINGGYNGLAERTANLARLKTVLF